MLIKFIITLYFYIFILYSLIIDTIIAILLKLIPKSTNLIHILLLSSGKTLLFLSGCRVKLITEYVPENKNYLIISNHQSMVDILVLNKILGNRQYRWIVKSSLFKLPFLGILMQWAGYISIDRKHKYRAYKSIQKAIKTLKEDASIIIFPEGTRSTKDEVMPFKSGSIRIAYSTNSDILPIILKNTLYVKRRGSFFINPMLIKAKIITPVKVKGKKLFTQRKVLDQLHKKISEEYKKL